MTDLEVFLKFKDVCPGNKEGFEPSAANRHRWLHHIQAVEGTKGFPKFDHDSTAIERIRKERRVNSIAEMSWYTACRYLRIAACFPGFQVYACGSRVRGDYVDSWDGDEVREARKLAGMSPKKRSDYDFWVQPDAVQIFELPEAAERVRCKVSLKIEIPMSEEWDFSRLPKHEFERVIELVIARDTTTLLKIHDEYKLSRNRYCCDLQPVENWFYWAVKNGIIQTDKVEAVAFVGD